MVLVSDATTVYPVYDALVRVSSILQTLPEPRLRISQVSRTGLYVLHACR